MDAADDPAIWIHPTDSSKSIIYGSNKTYGIDAFDLEGKRLHSYEVGRINNIDVRYGFPLNDTTQIDILAGTEREHNQILVFCYRFRRWGLDRNKRGNSKLTTRGIWILPVHFPCIWKIFCLFK